MNKTLHVLNGDATGYNFKDTGIAGDVVVWREVFSEGPLLVNINDAKFWTQRSQWIAKNFDSTPNGYQPKVLSEIAPLRNPQQFAQITLWFEFDLHCQVNLLGVLQLLQDVNLDLTKIYLICPATFPGMDDFKGLGELSAPQLASLYPQREMLTADDLALANKAWQIYTSNDAGVLKNWLAETYHPGNLFNLKPALQAHLKRLQINADGLNYISEKLMQLYKAGHTTLHDIHTAFWRTEKIFGMGDAEIDNYLRQLTGMKLIPEAILNT